MAFLDLNPVHPGHTLLIPKTHYADLLETGEKELSRLLSVGNKLAIAIMKAVNAPGFNIHINTKPEAGQVVFHTHLHILPRFKGDNLKHWQGSPADAEKRKEVAEKIKTNL